MTVQAQGQHGHIVIFGSSGEQPLAQAIAMSDLYRSAINARLAKLPPSLPTVQNEDDEGEEEMVDSIGDLPGSGLGPPAMQVNLS